MHWVLRKHPSTNSHETLPSRRHKIQELAFNGGLGTNLKVTLKENCSAIPKINSLAAKVQEFFVGTYVRECNTTHDVTCEQCALCSLRDSTFLELGCQFQPHWALFQGNDMRHNIPEWTAVILKEICIYLLKYPISYSRFTDIRHGVWRIEMGSVIWPRMIAVAFSAIARRAFFGTIIPPKAGYEPGYEHVIVLWVVY